MTVASEGRLKQLYEWIGHQPLQNKMLIAGSHAAGHTLIERVCREYGAVLQTEVRTLEAWVLQLAELRLAQEKVRYIGSEEAYWIIQHLLTEASADGIAYLAGMSVSPGIVRAFAEAVTELREAGIEASGLMPSHFETVEKGACVQQLLERYEQYLKENRLTDFSGLIHWVRKLPKQRVMVIIADAPDLWSAVRREMLEVLTAAERVHVLERDLAWTSPNSLFPAEEITFTHALGALAEVRHLFRSLAQQHVPWDYAEVIASDYETYAPAVYAMSRMYGVRCTFAGGLPISYTNAGKAADLYLSWLESNFNVDYVLQGLRQGVIRVGMQEDKADLESRCVWELEQAAIGWGRERYRLLDGPSAQARSVQDEQAAAVRKQLRLFFNRLFEVIPETLVLSPLALLQAMTEFVDNCCVIEDDMDRESVSGMKRLVQTMQPVMQREGIELRLAIAFVRDAISQLRAAVTAVHEPGALHITSLQTGGQCGRPYTYIIGMSERNWTVSGRQHPILLDLERIRISGRLRTSEQRMQEQLAERSARLGGIRGSCLCSYTVYDIASNAEHNPAYELLKLYRKASGQLTADYDRLHRYLGEPIGYFGGGGLPAIDELDVWLQQLIAPNGHIRGGRNEVLRQYAQLADGDQALRLRGNPMVLSAYDGVIDPGLYPLQPYAEGSSYLSASRLELFARCPLQYFYREVLGVRAKDRAVYDRSSWLDAAQRGTMLHAIYDRYLKTVARKALAEGLQQPKHDRGLLDELTEQTIAEFAELIPAPSAPIYSKERESIRQDVHVFFVSELERQSMPVYFEFPLHAGKEPLQVKLNNGLTVPVKGFVDRVDLIAPHIYKIYDYKTGSPKKYKEDGYFAGGTQLQLALYGVAVEQLLRQAGHDPEAMVSSSSYYFPTARGLGEEAVREQSDSRREELSSLIQSMLEAIGQGVFPPAENPDHCKWCDYQAVCGSHAEQFKEKREQAAHADRLRSVLEVNGYA